MLLATSIGACISPLVGFVSFKGQRVLAAVTGFFLVLIDVIFMIKCRRVLAEKVDAMKEGELSYSKAERYTRVIAKYSVQGSFYAISTFVAFCVWLAMGFYMGRAGKELKNGEQWVTGWMLVEVSVNFFIFMMGVSMVRMKLLLDKEARRERSIPATTEGDAKAVLTM
ncbi:hypothetical protein BCR33DRAFT_532287 [Rhizoclosmatium globosum]|uniref:Uncharacterized protein n=1 Tax=Rhizoclosmatium globosum TaxID=329046 RepID=A0A1Y2CW53_9FUNG|nr:hypothetical protein BCR33DRAFT_532287 [Rhizoclosmatium globosum]|eukprot:ORY50575.1 hypothetical protein BCR33DRAFT_532287 [Rhizoclosmatium globosum]